MCEVVSQVSDILNVHPPSNGGIDPKKLTLSGSTPATPLGSGSQSSRRSFVDQLGLDLFRNKSKDDLCPPKPPPPAVK